MIKKRECNSPFNFNNIVYLSNKKGKLRAVRYAYNKKGLLIILGGFMSPSCAFKIKEDSELFQLSKGKYEGFAIRLSERHLHPKIFPFVYLHEIGHIVNKHLESLVDNGGITHSISRLKGVPFGEISQIEIEADDFAMKYCTLENTAAFFGRAAQYQPKYPELFEKCKTLVPEFWTSVFSSNELNKLLSDLGKLEMKLRLDRLVNKTQLNNLMDVKDETAVMHKF